MKSYFLKCRKNTENINLRVSSSSTGRTMILSKCAICGSKKSRFIKNQEAKGLLSNLAFKKPLSKVPILSDILFEMCTCLKDTSCKQRIKMNEIVNKFLLAGDKFMPEMHLKQLGFAYSACGPFTKNKERIQKFKETGDKSYIYKNELDMTCFQLDMAYGDFKDIARRRASDKVLRDKAFNVAKNPKYDGYQRGLASIVYKIFDKKSKGSGVNANTNANDKIKQNWHPLDLTMLQLAEELHKPVIRKL